MYNSQLIVYAKSIQLFRKPIIHAKSLVVRCILLAERLVTTDVTMTRSTVGGIISLEDSKIL